MISASVTYCSGSLYTVKISQKLVTSIRAMTPTQKLLTSGGILLGGMVAAVAGLWVHQRRLVYQPGGPALSPAEVGLDDAEPVAFTTEDDLSLAGWFVPGHGPTPVGAVIVFHGKGCNRSQRAPLAKALAGAGLDVLLFDYRGYGGNPGKPTERGLLKDARAAQAWMAQHSDAGPDRTVYFAESLGCAVAVALALKHPPAAMILRSPFASLPEAARHIPLLPWLLLRDRYPVADQVGRYRGPVLVIAGDADVTVPPEQSRKVANAVTGSNRFVLIPGADHDAPTLQNGDYLLDALRTFLHEVGLAQKTAVTNLADHASKNSRNDLSQG